jgi:hypothetical protein
VASGNRSIALDSPTAWMCEYESALKRQDWKRLQTAKRELLRLGVRVKAPMGGNRTTPKGGAA